MKYRKLRIAWSVAWGIACLLLVALWVRSYWWMDVLFYRPGPITLYQVTAQAGVFGYLDASEHLQLQRLRISQPIGWSLSSGYDTRTRNEHGRYMGNRSTHRSYWDWIIPGFNRSEAGWAWVPMWIFVILSAALATAPWLRWRFSLRTLLIATTLVAVGLGLAVYAAR